MGRPRKTDALIPLQDLDLRIHQLKVQHTEKPRQLASFEGKVTHSQENVDTIHEEIKGLKLEGSKRELTVKEHDDKIAKIQTHSMTAKKNDEYQAFQKEISGIKAERSRIEDGLLDIYMQVDEKTKLENLRREELAQAQSDHADARKRIEGEMSQLDRDIEEELSKRAQLTGGVDKEVLSLYERVLRAKDDGIALALTGKYDTIDDGGKSTYWQCEGCSVGLNMQDLNLLLLGKEIHVCRNCSRILYLKAE